MEDEKVFSLRIPESLKKLLEERAAKNRRSLNQEIVTILERFAKTKEVIVVEKETRIE